MTFIHAIVDDIPHVPVITKIEVLRFNAPENAYKILVDFMDNSLVYGLNDPVVASTIQLGKSRKIKLPNAVIAATALVYDLTLLTRNESDFKNISGLQVVNPYGM